MAYTPWGSSKVQRTLSVTNEAWEQWTVSAEEAATNRSELFEVMARITPHLDITSLKAAVLSGDEGATLNALKACLT
ncbi:MAG: hypothetical protein ACO395_07940 [Pontimonas sp.]